MTPLEKRLNSLYKQKELIEQEILTLEAELNTQKKFSKSEKIALFKELFIIREDIYAKQWSSKDGSKKSFFPVTATFKGEDYLPLDNQAIEKHLRGQQLLASYIISSSNRCKFIALKIAPQDIKTVVNKLLCLTIESALQIDSNADYMLWIFFEQSIQAKNAKAFAQYILRQTNVHGKIYPSDEFVTNANLSHCLELPLHLQYRQENKTVFVNANTFEIIPDQWHFLHTIKKTKIERIQNLLQKDQINHFNDTVLQTIEFPAFHLQLYIYDCLYIPTKNLSASLINHLKSMASFENPQIKTLLALRRPLYNTPKVIRNYEEDEVYLKLPRGLTQQVMNLFEQTNQSYEVLDKTFYKKAQFKEVAYTLRKEQNAAIKAIKKENFSICVAPPGFGKTLIGAKMIEIRQANTLVVVNKNLLLDQWRERFVDYFEMNKKEVGFLGKGKNKLNGVLDVATMQSLKNNPDIIKEYAFVIVDECHHIPAVTFELIIKEFHGRYLLGLSATPNRKDGFEPILFQQLGQISYAYKKKRTITHHLQVVNTQFNTTVENYAQIINELCNDTHRNQLIMEHIVKNRERKILVLSDRIEHINNLEIYLMRDNMNYVTIHGSLTKKEQSERISKIESANLILATTSFFGEGIDFPHLNTIIFATPISYYGRLVQYLGRIGRDGQPCLAIDFLDSQNGILNATFKKRQSGYKQMHYKII